MRIRPARNITGGKDFWCASLEIFVYNNTPVGLKAGLLCQLTPRPHANADDDEVGRQHLTAAKLNVFSVNCSSGLFKMENHVMFLVELAYKIAVFAPEHALQGPAFWRHDMNIDFPSSQRGGDLQANEARAKHDRTPRLLCLSDDGSRVAERAQHMDMGLVRPGNAELNFDGFFLIKLRLHQRHRTFWHVAGEVVFRTIRPIIWSRIIRRKQG